MRFRSWAILPLALIVFLFMAISATAANRIALPDIVDHSEIGGATGDPDGGDPDGVGLEDPDNVGNPMIGEMEGDETVTIPLGHLRFIMLIVSTLDQLLL